MLVLTRKIGEKIVIDNSIIVTIIEVRGSRVRVGIDAPKTMNIRRIELEKVDNSKSDSVVRDSKDNKDIAGN